MSSVGMQLLYRLKKGQRNPLSQCGAGGGDPRPAKISTKIFGDAEHELYEPALPLDDNNHPTKAMAEKKRKRQEDTGSAPSKKKAIVPTGTVRVEHIKNDDALGPILGTHGAL